MAAGWARYAMLCSTCGVRLPATHPGKEGAMGTEPMTFDEWWINVGAMLNVTDAREAAKAAWDSATSRHATLSPSDVGASATPGACGAGPGCPYCAASRTPAAAAALEVPPEVTRESVLAAVEAVQPRAKAFQAKVTRATLDMQLDAAAPSPVPPPP